MPLDFTREYRRKLISAEEAAGLVKSGMWVDYGAICGFPSLIDEKLAARAGELKDVKIRAEHSHTVIPRRDPSQQHFVHNSWFLGKVEREYAKNGACSYIPFGLGEGPRMYRQWLKDAVDITFIEVTPMDDKGNFNFGTAVTRQKAACEVAKKVVLEVNEHMPWVFGGYDEVVNISQVDYIVENYEYKIPDFPAAVIAPQDEAIASLLAEQIDDGATIQLGVGAIPSIVGELLIKQNLKDLGIHSEMFNDSMMELIEAGVVTGKHKTLDPGKSVFCFAAGSEKLYKFMDKNPALAGFPVDYTNDPYTIAKNDGQIAINGALRIDLRGQVCSESVGTRQISGTGGQLEFTRGAYMSRDGKAFICLHAARGDKNGRLISNIVPTLEPGDMVTVPASDVSYVVTEYGMVNLKGLSVWQRAKALISIAHPDFREELTQQAIKAGFITRGTIGLGWE
ncbi:MAG: butyryl-CoA:acetate CoA-transferase [Dehalococcoidales bacterium]|nr:butyryl-CoA:acetate CoA-transferase [Dehalococcoidales bacterium]